MERKMKKKADKDGTGAARTVRTEAPEALTPQIPLDQ
jgi:hypothetical protein